MRVWETGYEMDFLKSITDRISDQRLLFLIVVVLVVGGVGGATVFRNSAVLGGLVLIGAFLLVGLLAFFDFRKTGPGLQMSIVLTFPDSIDPGSIRLSRCRYTVDDPRNPTSSRSGEVRPLRAGGGWICPIPDITKGDVVDFTFTEEGSSRVWVVAGFVPELNWPTVKIVEQGK